MTWPLNPPKSAGVVAAVFVAAFLVAPPASHAQSGSLDLPGTDPRIQFDLSGRIIYDQTSMELVIDAEPFFILLNDFTASPVLPATGATNADIVIRALVNNAGTLIGGSASGDDLQIIGKVPLVAGADGLLLAGEVRPNGATDCLPAPTGPGPCRGFGFVVGDSLTDFEFRFKVTGGALKNLYAHDVVVRVTSVPRPRDPNIPGDTGDPVISGFGSSFSGPAEGLAALVGLPVIELPAPPVLTLSGDVTVEATAPLTPVSFSASATDLSGNVPVTCAPVSGSGFPLGATTVTCSATNAGGTTQRSLVVTVKDTTPPVIVGGDSVRVQATEIRDGQVGAVVVLPWTAVDAASTEPLPVTCTPPSGSFFPVATTMVTCIADDGRGNTTAPVVFPVIVEIGPPVFPGGNCFTVNFREITFFRKQAVITSSDAGIRAAAGIPGDFNPALWPYRPGGGNGYTPSRATLFRLYGFQPSESGQFIPDADRSYLSYPVQYDPEVKGYFIDLGGPARVFICPQQLHDYVLAGRKGNGHVDSSTLLPPSQRNVPGLMLTHNSQILKLPKHTRKEMKDLGLNPGNRGLIDFIGVQHQGNGSAEYREFVNLEISFPGDSETDRLQHFKNGLHTATNVNFESFAGCDYLDHTPGNDAVRLRDLWGPNKSKKLGYDNWRACGTQEPAANKKVRANYDVPFNAIQLLPTVNTGTDTLQIYFGEIQAVKLTDRQKLEQKLDWREWEAVDK